LKVQISIAPRKVPELDDGMSDPGLRRVGTDDRSDDDLRNDDLDNRFDNEDELDIEADAMSREDPDGVLFPIAEPDQIPEDNVDVDNPEGNAEGGA
jgi:hypothetical protein